MASSFSAVFQDMACAGAADKIMVGATVEQSNLTLWRFVHMLTTAFAMEPVDFDASSAQARFGGQQVKFTFPRQGDLVWHTYAKIFLPGICGVSGSVVTAPLDLMVGVDRPYWTNAIGQYLLQEVKLAIGGTVIDTLYDTYLFMWEELAGHPGKRLGEMIGKFDTVALRQATSMRSRYLYVPLPFYFTENTGLSLPLVSLQFHQVNIEVNFAAKNKCYVIPATAPADTAIYVRPDGAKDSAIIAGDYSLEALTDQSIRVLMESCYVYLDHDERGKFAHGQFEQIITEVQQNHTQASSSSGATATETSAPTKVNHRLNMNHVVMEYIIAVRQDAKEALNEHFDFSGYFDDDADGGSGLRLDPIIDMKILFNNSERVQSRPGSFFRLVQPYQHHTLIPLEFIYVWSYAVDPEDPQPTGGANHSRIDNVYIQMNLDTRIFADSSTADIFVYGRSKNLLRYKHGLTSRKFA